jgi:SAM-dependent methyltransferase
VDGRYFDVYSSVRAKFTSVKADLPDRSIRRWFAWQLHKRLPDPGVSYQRVEMDRALLEEMAWRADERVLDVGCDRGRYSTRLAARVRRVVGLDLNHAALRQVDAARVPCVCSDGQRLPFGDGSFDTVLSHNAVGLLPDPRAAAGEFARCCRPGGRVVISVSNRRTPYARVNALVDRLSPRWPPRRIPAANNSWNAADWIDAFAERGLALSHVYSCNLSWPAVPRVRGWWIVPNRVMFAWSRLARRAGRTPLRTTRPAGRAYDYVLVFAKA